MFLSAKHILLGSAAVLLSLPAMAAEENSLAGVAPPTHALVSCPGVPSVPMTADAEQALPLRLVATLSCGGDVAVLSDDEGYTARVRSSDGKEGYVARMYLLMGKSSVSSGAPAHPLVATAVNGVARWNAGAPGCDQFLSQGRLVESLTANGVTVQVSLQDTGWKLRASVAISNQTGASLAVLPSLITLDELLPNLRFLPAQNPARIAHAVNHQSFWTVATAEPSPSAVVLRKNGSATTQNLAYRPNAAPDYLSQRLVLASARNSAAREDSGDPLALALKAGSLAAQQKIAGVIWFARDAGARELSLRVPAGDLVFDFPLSFEAHK
ncbi:MAG: SH3 domain-containing protein [Candidatus Acidiferrum sp.]|jgi:hypothetical protein